MKTIIILLSLSLSPLVMATENNGDNVKEDRETLMSVFWDAVMNKNHGRDKLKYYLWDQGSIIRLVFWGDEQPEDCNIRFRKLNNLLSKTYFGPTSDSGIQESVTLDFNICHWPDANFEGINLNNANMTGVIWPGVILINADLRKTNFTKAILENADMRGADIEEAIFVKANLNNAKVTAEQAEYLTEQGVSGFVIVE